MNEDQLYWQKQREQSFDDPNLDPDKDMVDREDTIPRKLNKNLCGRRIIAQSDEGWVQLDDGRKLYLDASEMDEE